MYGMVYYVPDIMLHINYFEFCVLIFCYLFYDSRRDTEKASCRVLPVVIYYGILLYG